MEGPQEVLVRVPLVKNDPVVDMMLRESCFVEQDLQKLAFHGLPLRLKWDVLVVVLGWKTDGSIVSTPSLVAVAELGEDGHYFKLETPTGSAAGHSFGGEAGQLPKLVMTSYNQRKDKLRLALRSGSNEVGFSNFALRDLVKGKPRVGWVKIKNESRDEKVRLSVGFFCIFCSRRRKGRRNVVVGSVHLGMLISPSLKAEVLFLIDIQEREVLFYQETETLVDLNPVFVQPSMTPFRWTDADGLLLLTSSSKDVILATIQHKNGVVDIVQPQLEPYWQCSVTPSLAEFRVDGCFSGTISEQIKPRGISLFEMFKCGKDKCVARAECRNARDLKLSVDDPSEDPLAIISIILAIVELKKKK
jgi:hypothetical protein